VRLNEVISVIFQKDHIQYHGLNVEDNVRQARHLVLQIQFLKIGPYCFHVLLVIELHSIEAYDCTKEAEEAAQVVGIAEP
jgi:hypothetical protein